MFLLYSIINKHKLGWCSYSKAYLLSFGGRYAFLLSFRWTMRRFGALSVPSPSRHAPANFAQLTVLNASFASLAFVKYRGAQIALWGGDRQCSLVLEYKRRGRCAVLLCIRICQRVRMEWKGCAVPFHQPYFYIIHIRILSECGV